MTAIPAMRTVCHTASATRVLLRCLDLALQILCAFVDLLQLEKVAVEYADDLRELYLDVSMPLLAKSIEVCSSPDRQPYSYSGCPSLH